MTASGFINFCLNFSRYFYKNCIIVQPARESPFLALTLHPNLALPKSEIWSVNNCNKGNHHKRSLKQKIQQLLHHWTGLKQNSGCARAPKARLHCYYRKPGAREGVSHQGLISHPTRFQLLLQPLSRAAISVWGMLQINSPLAWLSCQAPPVCNEPMNYILQLWHLWACSSKYCSSIVIYNLI